MRAHALHAAHMCAYLLQHAGSELHGLMVLLLQHIHVEVIQEVVPVIIHPALIQLRRGGEKRRLIRCKVLHTHTQKRPSAIQSPSAVFRFESI